MGDALSTNLGHAIILAVQEPQWNFFLLMKAYLIAANLAILAFCSLAPIQSVLAASIDKSFYIDGAYAEDIGARVDKLVREHFFDRKKAESNWIPVYKENRDKLSKCQNLLELTKQLNGCLASLNTSHCRFLTVNDETYFFLRSLFGNKEEKLFTGFYTDDKGDVKYVLDGGPARAAGIARGDRIISVDGDPYVGYANFTGSNKNSFLVTIKRRNSDKEETVKLVIEQKTVYAGYADATRKSARIIDSGGKKIGYLHLWSGGEACHEALEGCMEGVISKSDALVLDLRDGYGGNSLEDLDRFYRNKRCYPDIESIARDGKRSLFRSYYDKPMVALINGGSRSGKELLAYSLRNSNRAQLLGDNTCGAVVAGRLFQIDDRTALYLAVNDVTIDGVRLEGKGVAPHLQLDLEPGESDNQLDKALEILLKSSEKNRICPSAPIR